MPPTNFWAAFCPRGSGKCWPEITAICPRCRDDRYRITSAQRREYFDRSVPSKLMRIFSAAFCPKGLQNVCCRMGGICPTCRDDWVVRVSSQNGTPELSVNVAKGNFSRSTSPDAQSPLNPRAPCGKAAVTSAESGVCESRRQMFKRPDLQPRGRAHACGGHISPVRLRGVLRLHGKQHWEELSPVPPGRLAAPGECKQAGKYIHMLSAATVGVVKSEFAPTIRHTNLREDVFSQEEC